MSTNKKEHVTADPIDADSTDAVLEALVGAVYEVPNVLAAGLLEEVYKRALERELSLRGLRVKAQASFPGVYEGECVGEYLPDLQIEDVLAELKCVGRFSDADMAQCISYLIASHLPFALPINSQKATVN